MNTTLNLPIFTLDITILDIPITYLISIIIATTSALYFIHLSKKQKIIQILIIMGNLCNFLFKKFFNSNIKLAFLLPFILNTVENQLPTDPHSTIRFAFGILTLSLIVLFSYINVVGYLIALNLVSRYNIDTKYPKYIKIIKYFEKSSILIIVLELIIGLTFLIIIILLSLSMCGIYITIFFK